MLDFLPPIMEVVLSNGEGLLTHTASLRGGSRPITPHEPSSLGLAIVGATLIAIYYFASAKRTSRVSRDSAAIHPLEKSDAARSSKSPKRESERRRGAA